MGCTESRDSSNTQRTPRKLIAAFYQKLSYSQNQAKAKTSKGQEKEVISGINNRPENDGNTQSKSGLSEDSGGEDDSTQDQSPDKTKESPNEQVEEEIDWWGLILDLAKKHRMKDRVNYVEKRIEEIKQDPKLRVCLDPKKEKNELSMKAKIVTVEEKKKQHTYLVSYKTPFRPKTLMYFAMFQSTETRKKINTKLSKYEIISVAQDEEDADVMYYLIRCRTDGALMVKGQEILYLQVVKKAEETGEIRRFVEASTSVDIPSIPEDENYPRTQLVESGVHHIFNKEKRVSNVTQFTVLVPNFKAGFLILKPFLSKYQRWVNQQTQLAIKGVLGFPEESSGSEDGQNSDPEVAEWRSVEDKLIMLWEMSVEGKMHENLNALTQ